MPRKDRTFGDTDVLRIYNKHLTLAEQTKVKIVLCETSTDWSEIIDVLENIIHALKKVKSVTDWAKSFFRFVPGINTLFAAIDLALDIIPIIMDVVKIFQAK